MNEQELTGIISRSGCRSKPAISIPQVAATVSRTLAEGLTEGRYPADAPALAVAVTADLQSVNGDKHLRLVHHEETLPERARRVMTARNSLPWHGGPTRPAAA